MPLTVVIQGERGGYSEAAALKHFADRDLRFETRPTYLAVIQSLTDERPGVVPIENTAVGTFAPVADMLMKRKAWIAGEVVVPVDVALAVPEGGTRDGIERVVGFPELLERSRPFVDDHQLQVEAATDTAAAARIVAERDDPAAAALAPPLAAKRYGLAILDDAIQDDDAHGRLLVLRRFDQAVPDDADKTSIVFVTPDRPGALHKALEPFARRGINLQRIDARPDPDHEWNYAFHLDLEGALHDPDVEAALRELARHTVDVQVLGSYRSAEV